MLFEGLAGLDTRPARPKIRNKVELIHLIRHLHIEYWSLDITLPIKQIFEYPKLGMMPASQVWAVVGMKTDRATNMLNTLHAIHDTMRYYSVKDKAGVPILKVDTISLGAIRGGGDEQWVYRKTTLLPRGDRKIYIMAEKIRNLMPDIIAIPDLRHFCTRVLYGQSRLPDFGQSLVTAFHTPQRAARTESVQPDLNTSPSTPSTVDPPRINQHIRSYCDIIPMNNATINCYLDPAAPPLGPPLASNDDYMEATLGSGYMAIHPKNKPIKGLRGFAPVQMYAAASRPKTPNPLRSLPISSV